MTSVEFLEAAARGLLTAVFVLSGTTKLVRPFGAALALTRFRLARRVRLPLGRGVGVIELALGLGILVGPADFWLASAALTLLLFSFLIARALNRGERFECACFGARGEPLGIETLTRTLVLFLIAVIGTAAALGDSPGPSWTGRLAGLATGALILCQAFLIVELRRSQPFTWSIDLHGEERS